MAKLGIYYGLCPLIDQKSLLGVSEDKQNGCVIVTLGKNMAIKYKLSDQKQLHSWSTKEKLTSPVVYDKKNDRYVAVFNQCYLKVWGPDEPDLDKVKKFKFSTPLHTILEGKEEPILVFKDCNGFSLTTALETRKHLPTSKTVPKIINSTYFYYDNKEYIGSMVEEKKSHKFICKIINPKTDETETDSKMEETALEIEIRRENYKLNGHVIMESDNGPILYTLWSDGRLFSYPIFTTAYKSPGNFYSVIETLSRQNEICMVPLNKNYIAMFGSDINQEGASLQLYNTQFKITQSKLAFKFFSEGSKLWNIGNSLLLTVGQNLAVIPFSLATEQLAALVGSHKMISTNDDDLAIVTEVLVENWEEVENGPMEVKNEFKINAKLKNEITSLTNEGWSESSICDYIFPKLIEKLDTKSILELLDYFLDIPDATLVKLISYCISTTLKFDSPSVNDFPEPFRTFINKLLSISYNDSILMPHLRSLKFEYVLVLLQYISYFLSSNEVFQSQSLPQLSIVESETKLIDWACLLIDSHYQKFLLLKDPEIIKIFLNLKTMVDNYYNCLEGYRMAEPYVSKLKRGKVEPKISGNDFYSIEKIKLY